MLIKILPKSTRAKNRVAEHGQLMILERRIDGKFLVRSVDKTWRGEDWVGWFTDDEADYELFGLCELMSIGGT